MLAGSLNDAPGMGVDVDFGQFAVHAGILHDSCMADRRLMMLMTKIALVIGVPILLIIEGLEWLFGVCLGPICP